MAAKNVILTLLALASFAYGQTRALFVTTNGTVQWGDTLRFDGPLDFTTNGFAATTRSNLSLGLPALTNTSNAGLLSALGGLATNGDAAALTNFPASLLATNGDGSGLTNLPNANLSNATGVLPLANGGTGQTNAALAIEALLPAYTNNEGKVLGLDTNLALVWTTNVSGGSGSVTSVDASGGSTGLTFSGGPITNTGTLTLGGTLGLAYGGTGATNASGARTALELGTAATNDATAFQPASANLTNLAANNGGNLTNVSVDLTAVLPAYSNNAAKVLAVASGETNVEWIAVSNTVTDASTLTNFPASILQTNSADGSFPAFLLRTNGSAAGLTSFPASLLTTNGDASGLTNFPTLNQNTTGTASNVTGVVAIANGGSGQTTAAAAIEAFLPSYVGNADRILALNSNATGLVWTTNAGGGGGSGTVTSVAMTVPSFLSVSGSPITTNGTLAVSLSGSALPLANGGTGAADATGALQNLGIYVTNTSATGIKIGPSTSSRNYAIAIGQDADVINQDYGIAIGASAKVSNSYAGVAIGSGADALGEAAISIGWLSQATASGAVQLGRQGTNSTASTIQFLSAGTVDTNEWAALANAGTVGTNLLRAANITDAQAAIFAATTTNAPTNTNAPTPDAWLDIRVGTNDYKLPLWQ